MDHWLGVTGEKGKNVGSAVHPKNLQISGHFLCHLNPFYLFYPRFLSHFARFFQSLSHGLLIVCSFLPHAHTNLQRWALERPFAGAGDHVNVLCLSLITSGDQWIASLLRLAGLSSNRVTNNLGDTPPCERSREKFNPWCQSIYSGTNAIVLQCHSWSITRDMIC